MKTSIPENTFLSHTSISNQQPQCTTGFLQSWRYWPPVRLFKERAGRTKISVSKTLSNLSSGSFSNLMTQLTRLRLRVLAALAGAVNSSAIAKSFPRVFVGLVLLTIVAPYADIFYTRLDFNDRVSPDVWYYESYHWLFLCLGPYLKAVFQTLALYLIFSVRGNLIFALFAAYSLMYDIGKILWLLQVTNHEEYKALPTNWFLCYGFMAGLFLVAILDRLTYWVNHRTEAIKRRLRGLRNIVDKTDPQIIVNGFVRTMDDDELVQQFKQY